MTREQELMAMLHAFHLPSFAMHYESFARQAEKERLDHVSYLYHLAKLEAEDRQRRRTERLLREAHLPRGKRLDEFELSRIPTLSPSLVSRLAEGEILDRCENVLIFGNPGTGKSHLCMALAREWCLRGRRVRYTTASALVQELLTAKRDLALNALLRRLDRFEALIIDDLSYIPQDRAETDVLFVLLAERYEQRSVVVTSNLVFSDWGQIFKDPMTTTAAIDRLVHHSTILELNAESYRMTQARRKRSGRKDDPDDAAGAAVPA
ncbi:IS21-like element helper ATPase IstB [Stutzerimonas kunmingensis]|uniref:IS21-like element helper ATPase IstB n=1 Tax=Stutzerimonas kunmingensis TaxID=1211807 RepID=UPI002FCA6482